jgi:hypothetical protein
MQKYCTHHSPGLPALTSNDSDRAGDVDCNDAADDAAADDDDDEDDDDDNDDDVDGDDDCDDDE